MAADQSDETSLKATGRGKSAKASRSRGAAEELALDDAAAAASEESGDEQPPERMNLEVRIESPSACERHVTVTISRADIDRYFDNAFSDMMPNATVPGFRIGRAPRKLVESRFRSEIGEQIKGSLLMDSLTQISEDQAFTAISEPALNLEAVEVPEEGPMTFEFDIEVRPEFELPKWQGLAIDRPMREFDDADVDRQVEQMLTRYGQLVPVDRPVQPGDFVTANISCTHAGATLAREEDRLLRVRPDLSFLDARLSDFAGVLSGAVPGDRRTATVRLTQDAPNEQLRGQEVAVAFEVLEVKELKLPELTGEFLDEMGGFADVDEFRQAVRANLERQLQYEQQRKVREQISAELTKKADWDLPPALLKRQSAREMERALMELRRAGFSEVEIRARENELRQNSAASTSRALKEHFILERIAEEEELEAEQGDFDAEMYLIAAQSGESPRRVRAQIEKRGLMDVLQNQIVERKVLELVQRQAAFTDIPFEMRVTTAEAISMAAGGDDEMPAAANEEAGE